MTHFQLGSSYVDKSLMELGWMIISYAEVDYLLGKEKTQRQEGKGIAK
jgi:hypothetical protein